MANVTFTIPDEQLQRFIDGMAAHYGYVAVNDATGEVNLETKAQYARRKIRQEWIHRVYKAERVAAIATLEDIDEIDVQG